MGPVADGRIAMSLPPQLQYDLGVDRSANLSGRGAARRTAAQCSAVAAIRNIVGQMFVATGRRIMSDRPTAESRIAHCHHLSLSK